MSTGSSSPLHSGSVARVGSYSLSGQSALANELMQVPAGARGRLIHSDTVVVMVDVVVMLAKVLTDDNDPRPLYDRLEDLESRLPDLDEDQFASLLDRAIAEIEKVADPQHPVNKMLKRATSQNYRSFARRLVGAARHDRLEAALHHDAAVVVVALRRTVRYLMPIAAAIDNCLTPVGVAASMGFNDTERSFVRIAISLDEGFDKIFAGKLPFDLISLRDGEQHAHNLRDVEQILEGLRSLIENQAHKSLDALDETLARKVQGARDALEKSVDGASQAANSLIELINRLLRRAFSEAEALSWIRSNLPTSKELRYIDNDTGVERPTKQGHAICFLYAGKPISQENRQPIHEAMAKGITDIRRRLEQIKHADTGAPEEIGEPRELMAGVEGFITYAVRVGWNSLDEPSLDRLRRQFERSDAERVVA